MSQFDNLHRVLEAAKHIMSEYDDDFAEIQMILDLYEKMMNEKVKKAPTLDLVSPDKQHALDHLNNRIDHFTKKGDKERVGLLRSVADGIIDGSIKDYSMIRNMGIDYTIQMPDAVIYNEDGYEILGGKPTEEEKAEIQKKSEEIKKAHAVEFEQLNKLEKKHNQFLWAIDHPFLTFYGRLLKNDPQYFNSGE